MSTTPSFLQKQWEGISQKGGGFLSLDIAHPLEWRIGSQSSNHQTLVLVCEEEICAVASSKSMTVTKRRRESDNRWTLAFELSRGDQQDVFAIFCADIIEYSQVANHEKAALRLVIERYKQWSKLLEFQKVDRLDESGRKGLLGELLFLEQLIDASASPLPVVKGWAGPEGGDQDFVYANCWYEVKTLGASATNVRISSLEQLAPTETGELVIMRIDKTVPNQTGAISLNDVFHRIREKLKENAEVQEVFHAKLGACGFIDLQEYSETKYLWSCMQRYTVDTSFPKLIRETVPSEIVALSYELSLPALHKWQTR